MTTETTHAALVEIDAAISDWHGRKQVAINAKVSAELDMSTCDRHIDELAALRVRIVPTLGGAMKAADTKIKPPRKPRRTRAQIEEDKARTLDAVRDSGVLADKPGDHVEGPQSVPDQFRRA